MEISFPLLNCCSKSFSTVY